VASGGTWLDSSFTHLEDGAAAAGKSNPPLFNDRQRKVLRFVLEGLSNKEIAWQLQISESYVKAILQDLFRKPACGHGANWCAWCFEQYEDQL